MVLLTFTYQTAYGGIDRNGVTHPPRLICRPDYIFRLITCDLTSCPFGVWSFWEEESRTWIE